MIFENRFFLINTLIMEKIIQKSYISVNVNMLYRAL